MIPRSCPESVVPAAASAIPNFDTNHGYYVPVDRSAAPQRLNNGWLYQLPYTHLRQAKVQVHTADAAVQTEPADLPQAEGSPRTPPAAAGRAEALTEEALARARSLEADRKLGEAQAATASRVAAHLRHGLSAAMRQVTAALGTQQLLARLAPTSAPSSPLAGHSPQVQRLQDELNEAIARGRAAQAGADDARAAAIDKARQLDELLAADRAERAEALDQALASEGMEEQDEGQQVEVLSSASPRPAAAEHQSKLAAGGAGAGKPEGSHVVQEQLPQALSVEE